MNGWVPNTASGLFGKEDFIPPVNMFSKLFLFNFLMCFGHFAVSINSYTYDLFKKWYFKKIRHNSKTPWNNKQIFIILK